MPSGGGIHSIKRLTASRRAHPRYETVKAVLQALGVKFAIVPDVRFPPRRPLHILARTSCKEPHPMTTQLVLTFVGDDRPGLVNAISEAVATHGGTWLESRSARLAGKFAGVVLVRIADESVIPLESALAKLAPSGLRVSIERGAAAERERPRLNARRGAMRAALAIAHEILISAYHMLAKGLPHRELGEVYLDQSARPEPSPISSAASNASAIASPSNQRPNLHGPISAPMLFSWGVCVGEPTKTCLDASNRSSRQSPCSRQPSPRSPSPSCWR